MAGNVSVRYPSRKMGVTIRAESHRVELAGLYEYEHDQQVLEFYDQPAAIKLVYQAKNGHQVSIWHTPDYFVLRTDGIARKSGRPMRGWSGSAKPWRTAIAETRWVAGNAHQGPLRGSLRLALPPANRNHNLAKTANACLPLLEALGHPVTIVEK